MATFKLTSLPICRNSKQAAFTFATIATTLLLTTVNTNHQSAAASTQPATAAGAVRSISKLTPAEKAAGWTFLFNGSSTDQWRGYKQDHFPTKGWNVEPDGTLHVIANGGGGDIISKSKYSDFEIAIDFKISSKANSGIMYRVTEDNPAPWMTGPEFQILDDAGYDENPTDSTSVGGCYALYSPSQKKKTKPVGQFNHARIIIKNNRVTHFLNDAKILQYDLDSQDYKDRIAESKFAQYDGFGLQPTGHIALQDHGHDVWFKNIKIRELTKPMPGEIQLFNGKNLDGWIATFTKPVDVNYVWSAAENGILKNKGIPTGYLRTQKTFKNFVLKLQWRWDPTGDPNRRNSGVLIRKIGEDKVWPKSLECQLQNGSAGDFWNIDNFSMKTDPDRTIGRNTKKLEMAEYPVGQWNEYEIIADRENINVYVNGIFVNHAWDVDEIAGNICLQSEGAPLDFKNIRLAPIKY